MAFVDGDQEDFALLRSYPAAEWKGGRVHQSKKWLFGHLYDGKIVRKGKEGDLGWKGLISVLLHNIIVNRTFQILMIWYNKRVSFLFFIFSPA